VEWHVAISEAASVAQHWIQFANAMASRRAESVIFPRTDPVTETREEVVALSLEVFIGWF
jgi:hypothetical protein